MLLKPRDFSADVWYFLKSAKVFAYHPDEKQKEQYRIQKEQYRIDVDIVPNKCCTSKKKNVLKNINEI